jgi:hypothetical protein
VDEGSFDGLTRSLTASLTGSTTRRGITRLLSGLALGGPLALLGLAEAEAKCKKKKCGPCKRCKKGKCKPKPAGTACAGGACLSGACITDAVPASPPTLTCADQCPETCRGCFSRPTGGPPICGTSSGSACGIPCSSDADCAGTGFPTCVSNIVKRGAASGSSPCGFSACTVIAPC